MQYTIAKINNDAPNWQSIESLNIDCYPWYESGIKQSTQVKLAASETRLFLEITATDKYSYAKQTQLNHMLICEDSCVEFFFSPSGILGSSYVNLEVNCCGTLHIAYGEGREDRQFIELDAASLIHRKTSITSPVKVEQSEDNAWTVEVSIPFKVIEALTGEIVNREQWFGNFYRCGGRKEPQYAVWSHIKVATPDYHRPEYFGQLDFA